MNYRKALLVLASIVPMIAFPAISHAADIWQQSGQIISPVAANNKVQVNSLQVTSGSLNFTKVAAPTAPTLADLSNGLGSLSAGTYKYEVTYVNASGETNTSPDSSGVSVSANDQVTITIPTSTDASVTARKIYRTQVGGSTYTLVTTISDNTTITYTDGASDASIAKNVGGPTNRNLSGGEIMLGGSPVLFTTANNGVWNEAFGTFSNPSFTTGVSNVIVGPLSGAAITTGNNNTILGVRTGLSLTTGGGNTLLGAGNGGDGEANGQNLVSGTLNTLVGAGTGAFITGNNNTGIGFDALEFVSTGTNNVGLGNQALQNTMFGSTSIAIGNNANYVVPNKPIATVAPGTDLNIGCYNYRVTFVLGNHETAGSLPLFSNAVPCPTSGDQKITLTNIPTYTGPFSGSIQRKIYRTTVQMSATAAYAPLTYSLVATLGDNTTTTYSDTTPDASLGIAESDPSSSILLGSNSQALWGNQLVIGSSSAPIADAYLGQGPFAASPSTITLHSTGGSGANNAGANLVLAPGQGTGAAVGGDFIVQTASAGSKGSSFNPLTEHLRVSSSGLTSISGILAVSSNATINGLLTLNQVKFNPSNATVTATNCGTGAVVSLTSNSADAAGSFSLTLGSGTLAVCKVMVSFSKAMNTVPQSVQLTPNSAASVDAGGFFDANNTTSQQLVIGLSKAANLSKGTVLQYSYLVVQ